MSAREQQAQQQVVPAGEVAHWAGQAAGPFERSRFDARTSFWERLLVLNCYGTAFFACALVLLGAGTALAHFLGASPTMAAAVVVPPAALLAGAGARITGRLSQRERIFRTLLRRIERKGFRERYFETVCGDFCTRRVTWLVLRRINKQHLYHRLVRAFHRNGTFFLVHASPEIQALIEDGHVDEEHLRQAAHNALMVGGLPGHSSESQ